MLKVVVNEFYQFIPIIPSLMGDIKLKNRSELFIQIINWPGKKTINGSSTYKQWSLQTTDDPDSAIILNAHHIEHLEIIGLDAIEQWQPIFNEHIPPFKVLYVNNQ